MSRNALNLARALSQSPATASRPDTAGELAERLASHRQLWALKVAQSVAREEMDDDTYALSLAVADLGVAIAWLDTLPRNQVLPTGVTP